LSRRPWLIVVVLLYTTPLVAQDAPSATAEDVIDAARKAYTVPPSPAVAAECPVPKDGEEIVVCAQQQDQQGFRVAPSSDLEPAMRTTTPDVGTQYPGSVAARGCFIPPCPPPMPELIDLKAIPEAPPGSDADLVARGEKPQ
jgi:hypothetical protein